MKPRAYPLGVLTALPLALALLAAAPALAYKLNDQVEINLLMAGADREKLQGWALSFDQALGSVVGVFLRLGWQSEDAAVNYRAAYTGGLNFNGSAWGRAADNIGVAYGYLDGSDTNLKRTKVAEAYYRFAVTDHIAFTADVQYMSDQYSGTEDASGWVLGVRMVIEL